MNRLWKGFFIVLMGYFITGCGGGTTGTGKTAIISSSIKTGTTGAVFANFSGAVFENISGTRLNPVQSANLMNFTVTSKSSSNSGGTIKNSDVNINNITFTFTPLNNAPTFSPIVPTFTYAGLLPTPGSLDISNVPILWDQDIQQILLKLGTAKGLFQYDVAVTFTGIEVNTGFVLKNTINITACVQKK